MGIVIQLAEYRREKPIKTYSFPLFWWEWADFWYTHFFGIEYEN